MKSIGAAALLLAMVACTSPPSPQPEAAGVQTCTRETRTGTSLPVTVCRTPEQVARDRDNARQTSDEMSRGRARLPGPGGS